MRRGRALRWLGRGLLGGLALVLALGLTGAAYEAAAAARDRQGLPPPGRLVAVGTHRLHLDCAGDGHPTVLLETGLGAWSTQWALVRAALGGAARVCAYDRAAMGWSDPGPGPRTAGRIAAELHALLAAAGEPGPYVLVGHSNGGLYVRQYAAAYPAETAGLVLLDPTPADLFERLPATRADFAAVGGQATAFRWLAHVGLVRALSALAPPADLAAYAAPERTAILARQARPGHWQGVQGEAAALEAAMAEVAALRPTAGLEGRPLIVLSSTVGAPSAAAARLKLEADAAAALSADGHHVVVAGATHQGLAADPAHARGTAAAIRQVVTAVRAGQPVALASRGATTPAQRCCPESSCPCEEQSAPWIRALSTP